MNPELLMPAGSLEKLKYAYNFGADAVYVGVPLFSLRARENEMTFEDLEKGIQFARDNGKQIYVTANIFARNLKLKSFRENFKKWVDLKPDAFIMSDPGLMMIAKEVDPDVNIHLSVQSNCMNWQSVKFWQQQGATRIILSRELRLEEIKEIHERVPDIELEAFVHGSICIAYSGRCLLSHYMSYRDANQGVCDNSCRYGYNIYKADASKEEEFYLEDLRNKGQFYQIDEDENGTYIMNAKDLCVIEHLRELRDAGVCSFKVEGRTKSVYYAAMTSRIYRKAIDDMTAGKEFDRSLLLELDKIANRGYHKGFVAGNLSHHSQEYRHSTSRNYSQKFAGIVLGESEQPGYIKIEARHRLRPGEEIEVISPTGIQKAVVGKIVNDKQESVAQAGGGGLIYHLELPIKPPVNSLVSLLEKGGF
ncbi:U32 family peptidase C-terminal domain-containing protein [Bdellovibrio bacteriovorus]|uniref:U32 family peptidase C-terminal domain-containing protein n=1 Tax=Bdellovibrio bacteriovorus TaxID=959 RepID=UPI0021D2F79B|nr:U32 family peptidase C-terminal domain-containing protein [Bdellovibrio bacteriovorus]UXR64153.1 U32 family peptidase C-terminal domain-containing protein [Bdellovibrio bacteriovorus]